MEICEDRSDESDSYGDDGSDSEVEYGLVSHVIDLLSLSGNLLKQSSLKQNMMKSLSMMPKMNMRNQTMTW